MKVGARGAASESVVILPRAKDGDRGHDRPYSACDDKHFQCWRIVLDCECRGCAGKDGQRRIHGSCMADTCVLGMGCSQCCREKETEEHEEPELRTIFRLS